MSCLALHVLQGQKQKASPLLFARAQKEVMRIRLKPSSKSLSNQGSDREAQDRVESVY